MPKKKRKKYNFLAEQKHIKNKELQNLLDVLEQDQNLAHAFLDDYTPKFPQLYRHFQERLQGSVPGCIYIRIEKQKATQKETPLDIAFFPKSFFEEMLETSHQHPEVKNILDCISAWEKDRQLVPVAIGVGYHIQATTFPVPSSEEIIE